MLEKIEIALLLSWAVSVGGPNAKGWRDIEPLHSTRQDVEKLLGTAVKCTSNVCTYKFDDANVQINYSRGDCKSGRGGWDVPVDTVVYVTVHPKPSPRWSSLNIDKTKLSKREVGHIKQVVSYINESEGLVIEVDEGIDEVLGFYYVPSDRDKHLRCP